jgi:hypothetical protein
MARPIKRLQGERTIIEELRRRSRATTSTVKIRRARSALDNASAA